MNAVVNAIVSKIVRIDIIKGKKERVIINFYLMVFNKVQIIEKIKNSVKRILFILYIRKELLTKKSESSKIAFALPQDGNT